MDNALPPPEPWTVVIVEDDLVTREFFSHSVRQSSQLGLLAELDNVTGALAWAAQHPGRIDVLLIDLGLPDGSGLQVIRQFRRTHPECEALVISMFGDEERVIASVEAGAQGYLLKDSSPRDIAQTILDMKAGASPISPTIARSILTRVKQLAEDDSRVSRVPVASDTPNIVLTPKERAVLDLIARGFSYAEIARLQNISIHTVRSHIKNLYAKMAVHSRGEAVYEASRVGLLPWRAEPH